VCICLADLSLDGPQHVGDDVAVSLDVRVAREVVLVVIGSTRTGNHLRMHVSRQAQQAY
jgi:hypothetical protein